jgi:peptide/nickel transport system substrate-binding protein
MTLACGSFGVAKAQIYGGTLTVGLPYDIDTLNAYTTATLGDVESAVVEGLLVPDQNARYIPVLATEVPSVENGGIQLSPDHRKMTITYHLRPGVTWHDGASFTSEDVKFTWETVNNPKYLAESKDGAKDVESIETPDPLTAVVRYKGVSPNFASTLFTFGIFPKHLLEGKDLNHDSYNDKPLGTGPFMVKEFRRGQYVILERNPNYWRRDAQGRPLPYIDRVIYKLIPNTNTLGTLIRSGDIMFAPRIPYMLAKQLQGAANVELVSGPSLGWARVDFGQKSPTTPLRDPVLRRAMALSVNRAALIKAAGGYPEPIHSPVLPVLEGLFDPSPEANAPDLDLAAANQALDAAGYPRGADGYRSKNGVKIDFGFTTQAGVIDFEITEQVLIAGFKAIGIRVHADNKTGIAYRETRYKGAYDLLFGRWVTAPDPVYSVFFGSHGPLNGLGYSSAELDAALEKMESSLDPAERREASAAMQRVLARDLPSIPLFTNVSIAAISTRLKNFIGNPTNMTDTVTIAEWYLEPLPVKVASP